MRQRKSKIEQWIEGARFVVPPSNSPLFWKMVEIYFEFHGLSPKRTAEAVRLVDNN